MKINKIYFVAFIALGFALNVKAQETILLYKGTMPNLKSGQVSIDTPVITAYLPDQSKSTGTGVLVIPGGAYSFLAIKEEGHDVAKALAKRGIAAFVLKYRLPSETQMVDKSVTPIMDAQQAIRVIKQNAVIWKVDTTRLGVMGFSAGGHLASMLGTHFQKAFVDNSEKINLRPAFMILVYPVISMDNSLTHRGSRIALLGEHPTMEKVLFYSSEEQVTKDTPPTYLTHAGDDEVVDVQNSIEMYQALLKRRVSAELHLYPKGNHGFTQRLLLNEWLDPMLLWLSKEGFYQRTE